MFRRLQFLALILSAAFGVDANAVSVNYAAPAFLDGPTVANSLLSTTYSYRSRDPDHHTSLQITVVKLPNDPTMKNQFSADHCIDLFLAEVSRDRENFFSQRSGNDLNVGALNLQQVRWTRKDTRSGITGVTSCGLDGNRYVSINFQDALKHASDTFPAIRNSLVDLGIDP